MKKVEINIRELERRSPGEPKKPNPYFTNKDKTAVTVDITPLLSLLAQSAGQIISSAQARKASKFMFG
jgi:hypothetical protein